MEESAKHAKQREKMNTENAEGAEKSRSVEGAKRDCSGSTRIALPEQTDFAVNGWPLFSPSWRAFVELDVAAAGTGATEIASGMIAGG
jgi:hypothetical protein